jgi:hypothetical protein
MLEFVHLNIENVITYSIFFFIILFVTMLYKAEYQELEMYVPF